MNIKNIIEVLEIRHSEEYRKGFLQCAVLAHIITNTEWAMFIIKYCPRKSKTIKFQEEYGKYMEYAKKARQFKPPRFFEKCNSTHEIKEKQNE